MTPIEANKIIAEFIGTKEIAIYYIDEDKWCGGNSLEYTKQKCENYQRQGLNCELRERVIVTEEYSESLDSLIPVWKRMYPMTVRMAHSRNLKFNWFELSRSDEPGSCDWDHDYEECRETMQESAAIATAKAILELK